MPAECRRRRRSGNRCRRRYARFFGQIALATAPTDHDRYAVLPLHENETRADATWIGAAGKTEGRPIAVRSSPSWETRGTVEMDRCCGAEVDAPVGEVALDGRGIALGWRAIAAGARRDDFDCLPCSQCTCPLTNGSTVTEAESPRSPG